MAYGWEGEKVRLIPLDPERHFDFAMRLVNDPDVTQWLKIGDFPISTLAEREWMEKRSRGMENDIMFAIETLDGKVIGFSGLHKIEWRNGVATTGTAIGDKSQWGKGYGSDAARVRSRYAFEVLGLRMLLSSWLEGNEASKRMLLGVGYELYGTAKKRLWKRGEFRDLNLCCLTREAWLAKQKPG